MEYEILSLSELRLIPINILKIRSVLGTSKTVQITQINYIAYVVKIYIDIVGASKITAAWGLASDISGTGYAGLV